MVKNPPFTRIIAAALFNLGSREVSRSFVGTRVAKPDILIVRENVDAFAKATNDRFHAENPEYVPLFYPARLFHPFFLDIMSRRGIGVNLVRVVHGETMFSFHKPLAAGDRVNAETTLDAVEKTPAGEMLVFASALTRGGDIVCERRDGFLVRSGTKSRSSKGPAEHHRAVGTIVTEKGMSRRYAVASLDTNPIHVHGFVARAAGFRGVICHGLCTLALTANELIHEYADSRPERLRSVSARFSGPVYPGDILSLEEVSSSGGKIQFEARSANGRTVLSKGCAEVSP
jgi:acyl dehydratase